jgi:integrase
VRQSAGKEELLAAATRYVRKRNGVFQYERRVPERVRRQPALYAFHFNSRPLFRVSLRTRDQGEMHRAALATHADFERRIASTSVAVTGTATRSDSAQSTPARIVTQADLDELSDLYRKLKVGPFEKAYLRADASPADAEEYNRMVHELDMFADDLSRALEARGQGDGTFETPMEAALWVVENRRWNAPAGSDEFAAVVGAIRAGWQRGYDDIQAIIEGRVTPRLAERKMACENAILTLGEAVARYLEHQKRPTRTETEVRSSLRLFEQIIGNKRLDALTRKDFQSYAEYLSKQVIGGKTAGSVSRPASLATVRKRIGLLRTVINHAIHRDWFGGPNPASGIKVEAYVARPNRALMPEKRRLTVDEMNLVFQHPWFTGCASQTQTHVSGQHRLRGSEYWVPIVAALTGCRASELGGLMVSEVMIDDTYPHLIIRDNSYRRTKGGYSRKVPILDALISIGFPEYVRAIQASGADRLFPDWLSPKGKESTRNDDKAWSNARILRAFNRTVIPNMLKGRLLPGARQEVTFHSFRGAFKAMLGSADYRLHPNIINEVLGHAKTALDMRYVGEVPIEETYPAVRACMYKGLILPRLI